MRKLIILVFPLVLVSCSNSKTPNAKNFQEAINNDLMQNNFACISIFNNFPVSVIIANQSSDPDYPKLEALKKVGLVSSTDIEKKMDTYYGHPIFKVHSYDVTPEGKKFLSTTLANTFCYAEPQVAKIINWTEPSADLGETLTNVTYTYQLKNIASWANDPTMRDIFPKIVQLVENADKEQRNQDLTLTNTGWKVPHQRF